MASEDTLLGNELRLQLGDGNSPETFVDVCSVVDATGIGENKPQVDVTSQCDEARVFRNGLKEGAEYNVTANFVQGDTQTQALFALYQGDAPANMRLNVVGSSPAEYFGWRAIVRGWTVAKPVGDKATMQFTMKIISAVSWVHA